MPQITFKIEFDDDGTATIRLPEGGTQKVDAAKVADLTDVLSKLMGTVQERHIGDHHHGHGDSVQDHGHVKDGGS